MLKIRWRLHLTFAAISIIVGFVIAFFMLGNTKTFTLMEPVLGAVIYVGAQIWGGWVGEAFPEGGPGAFVALFLFTFWPLLSIAIYFCLLLGNRWRAE